MTGAPNKGGVG